MKKFLNSKLFKLATVSLCVISIPMSGFAKAHTNAGQGQELRKVLSAQDKRQKFEYVAKKLDEYKLPRALALIPVIESQYNNNAVSHVGAGGMWQIMPATAKQYGISNQARFQLEPSTVAALKYFNVLYKKFGNLEFAVASYNAGEGRVQKALSKNPTATTAAQLKLPLETTQYVQKFNRLQAELRAVSV
jgi:soluble lytic murein transglycosylase-like protein